MKSSQPLIKLIQLFKNVYNKPYLYVTVVTAEYIITFAIKQQIKIQQH